MQTRALVVVVAIIATGALAVADEAALCMPRIRLEGTNVSALHCPGLAASFLYVRDWHAPGDADARFLADFVAYVDAAQHDITLQWPQRLGAFGALMKNALASGGVTRRYVNVASDLMAHYDDARHTHHGEMTDGTKIAALALSLSFGVPAALVAIGALLMWVPYTRHRMHTARIRFATMWQRQ